MGRLAVYLLTVCALVSCASGDLATSPSAVQGVVRGTVSYRERIALPADAVVDVALIDVSRQDVATPVVTQVTFQAAGRQVPLPFELAYDERQLDSSRRYAVRATIRIDGRLAFTTDTVVPVITLGNPTSVSLTLVTVGVAP